MLSQFKKIRAFAFDIDGVLTNGSLLIYNDGQMIRQMNIKDGYALQLAIKKGFAVVIISGGNSEAVKSRLEKLGIQDVYLRVADKRMQLEEWCLLHDINLENVLYMGDDMPDITAMQIAGLSACPSDAASEVKRVARYVSAYRGGESCVRDVIEKVLQLHNCWE